jgi:cell division septum initiation protein DivIVA
MSTTPSAGFPSVRRGYDPNQVDRRLSELTSSLDACRQQNAELSRRVAELEEERAASQDGGGEPSYAGLGARIEQMLELADAEAQQLRSSALDDANSALERAEAEGEQIRADADRYAQERRSDAAAEATRVLEEAQRAADQMRDEVERDTRTRREEAEAIFERNRAKVAQAAADFETTLSQRRDQAQRDFTQQMNANQEQLSAVEQRTAELRVEAEKQRAEADRKAAQLLEDAQRRADELVTQARTNAERVRTDSDRELAAASQRRDSINAQLANVRQMLATLTGATLPNPSADDAPEPDQEHAQEPTSAEAEVEPEAVLLHAAVEGAEGEHKPTAVGVAPAAKTRSSRSAG